MKNVYLFIALFFTTNIFSQTVGKLWGMTPSGGKYNGGTVFYYDPLTQKDSVIHVFENPYIKNPYYCKLLLAPDGNYYGLAPSGDLAFDGGIFKYTPEGKIVLCNSFQGNLAYPYGSLIQANDGNLYGLCISGSNFGHIFGYNTSNGQISDVFHFDNARGYAPFGSLIQKQNGYLYGLTSGGGASDDGVVFSCDLSGNYNVIENLTAGSKPNASLFQASDKNLYGTASGGGTNGKGYIFKIDTLDNFSVVVDFDSINGSTPMGSLTQAADGNLYGMTYAGGVNNLGVIFRLSLSGTITKVTDFNGSNGAKPYGDLLAMPDGHLYGMTSEGGPSNSGIVFITDTLGQQVNLYTFNNNENPRGSLTMMPNGNLLGMTLNGGVVNGGYVFQLQPGNFTGLVAQTDFNYSTNGSIPYGTLKQVSDGNLYGLTNNGGLYNKGVLFKINPKTNTYMGLCSFDGSNGANPSAGLIQCKNYLYGTTYYGGTYDKGVIFRYDTLTHILDTVASFNGINGANPMCDLVMGDDSLFYGTASSDDVSGYGSVFKIDLRNPQPTIDTLAKFDGTNGSGPYGSLINKYGTLFGTTYWGGTNGQGNFFSAYYSTAFAGKIFSLHDFTNGENPSGNLIAGSDGYLYGMTYGGGANSNGEIFYTDNSGFLSTLYSFSNNEHPYGSLTQGANGLLYGMTSGGGNNNNGSIFSIGLAGTSSLNSEYSFSATGNDGVNPSTNNLMEFVEITSFDTSITCHQEGVNIKANIRGIHMPNKYSWSNGTTNDSLSGVPAGSYTLTFTNADGAITTKTTEVSKHDTLLITPSADLHFCLGDSVHLSANISGGTGALSYNWNPGNLSGNFPIIHPNTSSYYTVTVTDANGCSVNSTQHVIKDVCSTNINSVEQNNSFFVSPNPSSGSFIIHLNEFIVGAEMVITDVLGKRIFSTNITKEITEYDLKNLNNGIYFISIIKNNSSSTKRLIIQGQ